MDLAEHTVLYIYVPFIKSAFVGIALLCQSKKAFVIPNQTRNKSKQTNKQVKKEKGKSKSYSIYDGNVDADSDADSDRNSNNNYKRYARPM